MVEQIQNVGLSLNALKELLGSEELADTLSEPCACGAPRVLSLGLDSFICSDKGCTYRAAARLYAIAVKHNLTEEVSLQDLEYLCQDRYYRSWLDFFTDEWEDSEWEDIFDKLVFALKSELDVTSLLVLSGLDILTVDQLYLVCGDFQTVSEFASVFDTEGLTIVSERLGVTESHLLPAVIHIFNRISKCLSEALEAEETFRSL